MPCDRLTPEDMRVWCKHEAVDAMNVRRMPLDKMSDNATQEMLAFIGAGPGYAGVSWGKDSMVMAHLIATLGRDGVRYPLVWIKVEGRENPFCIAVRDAFLQRFGNDVDYHEIEAKAADHAEGQRTSSQGFKMAADQFGARHISGVRAEESRVRRIRTIRWGLSSLNTCAPIAWWKAEHVFAYLHKHDLPVHPAYAMSMGGAWDRKWLRVASIGGMRGTERGRGEWEKFYYPEEHAAARAITGR